MKRLRRRLGLLLMIILTFALMVERVIPSMAQDDGILDVSFGSGGVAVINLVDGYEYAIDVALQDEKIIVGGIVADGGSTDPSDFDFGLARLNVDGTLDATFGSDGMVGTDFYGSHDGLISLAVDGKNNIIAVGHAYEGDRTDPTNSRIAVARYTPDGSPDLGFGENNTEWRTYDPGLGSGSQGKSLVLLDDGQMLVIGTSFANGNDAVVARINENGALDLTFGEDGTGFVIIEDSNTIDSHVSGAYRDEKLVLAHIFAASGSDDDIRVLRLNADGTLDTTFDGDGRVDINLSSTYDFVEEPAIQPDGKILLPIKHGGTNNLSVMRLNADGSVDTGFGVNGVAEVPNTDTGLGSHVLVQSSGKIIVIGRANNQVAVARFDSTGILDTTFGISGLVQLPYSLAGKGILQDRDGVFVVGRTTTDTSNNFFVARLTLKINGCFVDAPASVYENQSFTATITCGEQEDSVFGFEFSHSVDSTNPVIFPQATSYTEGSIFDGKSSYVLDNALSSGYALSLLSPAEPTTIIDSDTLGSVVYDTDLPGTVIFNLDTLILGNEAGQQIATTIDTPTVIQIINLPLAEVEGTAMRETGSDTGAAITLTIDSVVPISSTVTNGTLYFEYDETVALDGNLEVDAPGHLYCSQTLDLVDEVLNTLPPITLLAGDVNNDGEINIADASIIVSHRIGDDIPVGSTPDLNEDGETNILDLIHVGRNFASTQPNICFGS